MYKFYKEVKLKIEYTKSKNLLNEYFKSSVEIVVFIMKKYY